MGTNIRWARKGLAVAVIAATCWGVSSAQAAPPTTAEVAHAFITALFVNRDMSANDRFLSKDFIQHSPMIKDGPAGDKEFLEARRKRDPKHYLAVDKWRDVIDHVLVDGDSFAVYHHVYTNPHDHGRVFLDIWRVKGGKLVEHWDVIQPVPAKSVNNNTMW